MRAERAEYWTAKNGKTYFRHIARNGVNADPSQGYSTPSNCRRAIQSRWPGIRMVPVSPPRGRPRSA